jgi:hypothetical protein
MKFKAFLFEIIKVKSSITRLTANFGVLIALFGLLIYFLDLKVIPIYESNFFSSGLFIIGMLLYGFANIYQFSDMENVESNKSGFLEFTDTGLILNYSDNLEYNELTTLKFSIKGFENEKINYISASMFPTELKSCGLLNKISLGYNNEIKEFNFKLENESHIRILQNNLFELVIQDKLKNLGTKNSLRLIDERFKKTEKFKNYIIQLLKEKRVDCTEGLLMIGYKSYEESKKMKLKYCG